MNLYFVTKIEGKIIKSAPYYVDSIEQAIRIKNGYLEEFEKINFLGIKHIGVYVD